MSAISVRATRITIPTSVGRVVAPNRRRKCLYFAAPATGTARVGPTSDITASVGFNLSAGSDPITFRWYADPELVQAEWFGVAAGLGIQVLIVEITEEG